MSNICIRLEQANYRAKNSENIVKYYISNKAILSSTVMCTCFSKGRVVCIVYELENTVNFIGK